MTESKVAEKKKVQTEKKPVGRPISGEERMVLDSFSIPVDLLNILREATGKIVDKEGKTLSKAAIIREGIVLILTKQGFLAEK